MKIVIDARFFGTETGIGRYVKELVENLEKSDRANNYVIFLSRKNWDLYNPKNKNFTKKLADIKWYTLREQLSMGRLVDKEKADLAHFPHFNVPFFCRTPYVVTIHDLILRHFPTSAASTRNMVIFYLKYFLYSLVLRRAIKKSKKVIAPSYFVRNDIIGNFKTDPDKIRVICEGVSELPKTDLGEELLKNKGIVRPYILYVGNAYPHKNLKNLCEAFFELKKEMPEVQLVFVGKRDYFGKKLERNIKYQISNIDKQAVFQYPNIIFYGYATDEELFTLYKHASLYVFPSLMEGFGLPALEALSYGLPVAVSDIPVFHEILGEAVSYFDPQDVKNIREILKNILKNNTDKNKILSASRVILSRYSWSKNALQTLELYNKMGLSPNVLL